LLAAAVAVVLEVILLQVKEVLGQQEAIAHLLSVKLLVVVPVQKLRYLW
jgi:hypothetical protein